MENSKEPSKHRPCCQKRSKGFSLMEVIIACFILVTGITGVFFTVNQIMKHMAFFPSELIAAYLAQEGIEITRNIRDTNWLEDSPGATVPWNDGLSAGDWQADYNDTSLVPFSVITYYDGEFLSIDTNGFYYYNPVGERTKFTRKITIASDTGNSCNVTVPQADDCLSVSVTVYWREKGLLKQVAVKETLYNWH